MNALIALFLYGIWAIMCFGAAFVVENRVESVINATSGLIIILFYIKQYVLRR